jgi:hypothetical protein
MQEVQRCILDIIQIQPFYEVDTSLYRPKRCISTEDVVRGRYTTCIDWIERLYFFILLIDNFTVIWFVQCPSHIFYIINCHAKHETENLQMDSSETRCTCYWKLELK